ncbi:MAG: hypothetical protein ACP5N3_01615 [Candidatus Nanoarchaeia archaeon]
MEEKNEEHKKSELNEQKINEFYKFLKENEDYPLLEKIVKGKNSFETYVQKFYGIEQGEYSNKLHFIKKHKLLSKTKEENDFLDDKIEKVLNLFCENNYISDDLRLYNVRRDAVLENTARKLRWARTKLYFGLSFSGFVVATVTMNMIKTNYVDKWQGLFLFCSGLAAAFVGLVKVGDISLTCRYKDIFSNIYRAARTADEKMEDYRTYNRISKIV